MSFLPNTLRIVPGSGDPNARICIIGDAPGTEDDRLLRPFAGPSGTVLESCLHAAGISRSDCYLTNVIKTKPRNNDTDPYYNPKTGAFSAAGKDWLDALEEELHSVRANVLVPIGSLALAALTGRKAISKYRGYVMESLPRYAKRKVIPSYHPSASLRGQYILRYYITADFRKSKVESEYSEIRRPKRNIIIPTTIHECREWYAYLMGEKRYGCDIEVVNFEVSCISFAPSPGVSVSFPMYHDHWNEEEETEVWRMIDALLNNGATVIFQNGIFDINFLATQSGLIVTNPIEDSMIAHSVMYPEMLKGLGFLVSMYCGSQEYYKDMVKWDNIKEES